LPKNPPVIAAAPGIHIDILIAANGPDRRRHWSRPNRRVADIELWISLAQRVDPSEAAASAPGQSLASPAAR
jgi:hypothetical protein